MSNKMQMFKTIPLHLKTHRPRAGFSHPGDLTNRCVVLHRITVDAIKCV